MKIKLPVIALAALLFAGLPLASSHAFVAVSVGIAPPPLPVYEQPLCPAPGYIWVPGYWAYADFGYYWVPGVWTAPPRVGLYWTPGYWGFHRGHYVFNNGYWGPTVGFYGGINYGFGYGGHGYYGGEWSGGVFRYNTAVTRVNTTIIKNTYVNRKVINNNRTRSRASFNGPKGVEAKPTAKEQAAAKGERIPPTSAQRSRIEAAKKDPALHAKNNGGKPKPDAVRAFHEKHGPKAGAAARAGGNEEGAANQARAGKKANGGQEQTGADEQTRAGKRNRGADQAEANGSARGGKKADQADRGDRAERSRRGAKAQEGANADSSHAMKASRVRHNAKSGQPGAEARGPRRSQAATHRPRGQQMRQGGPAGRAHGAAQGQQDSRKKKKRAKQGPDGR